MTRAALESAMRNDKLVLYYQPKVHSLSGHIIGAEALVRWSDGENLIISPDRFLPLAEDTGLLHDLTLQLLDQVVEASVSLRHSHPKLSLSINVAPNDLASSLISNRIEDLLNQRIIEPDNLQIEITESALIHDPDRAMMNLDRIHGIGVQLAIDDFGTGFSSMSYLSRLPIDKLKIDKEFVDRLGEEKTKEIVRGIVNIAHSLDITVIAEGVETIDQVNQLKDIGVEQIQGYVLSPALPYEGLLELLEDRRDNAIVYD